MLKHKGNWESHLQKKEKKGKIKSVNRKNKLSKGSYLRKNRVDITRNGTEIWKNRPSSGQWTGYVPW